MYVRPFVSLMRMVNLTHDYDKRDDWFPYSQFPIFKEQNIQESPAYGIFVLQLIGIFGFVLNMTFCSEDLLYY